MKVDVLNGVNLDVLERRDPAVYGGLSLHELEQRIEAWADAVIANPGAWSHYSYAIHDALELFSGPLVEVHLSNPEERAEVWRHVSVIAPLAAKRILGRGPAGYREALEFLGGAS